MACLHFVGTDSKEDDGAVNALSKAEHGYFQSVGSTRSHSRTEYEVIARITRRLRDAASDSKENYPAFVAALDENRRLWQVFATDIVSDGNSLPKELKARIYYLSEFTSEQTRKILREKASVLPLLEINMAILRGLSSQGNAK